VVKGTAQIAARMSIQGPFLAACLLLVALPTEASDRSKHQSVILEADLHFLSLARSAHQQQKVPVPVLVSTELRSLHAFAAVATDCPSLKLMIPVMVAAIAVMCTLVWLRRQVRTSELVEQARLCILFPQFFCIVGSTIIVIDSAELAKKVDMAPGESGQLVGLNWLGSGIGFLAVWLALRQDPMIWRKKSRTIFGSGVVVSILGCILFICGAHAAEIGASRVATSLTLKGARVLGGLGQGIVAQMMVVTIQSVTAKADMAEQMTRVFTVNAVGVGSGPVLAACGHFLAACPANTFSLVLAPAMQLVFFCGCLISVFAWFPDMSKVPLPDAPTVQSTTVVTVVAATSDIDEPSSIKRRQILIVSCISLFLLRGFVVSGVEVGSALLLERDFGIDRRLVGVAIGITIMVVLPVRVLYQRINDSLTKVGWFRVFATLAFAGTSLLFQAASRAVPEGAALLLADAIIFPSITMADGISYGVLMVEVFPDGSFLDKNNTAALCNVLGMCFGRLSGPWLARYSLEALGSVGQNRYAFGQTLACAATLFIFEVGVRPGIK